MAYRPRYALPLLLVRARSATLRMEVWDDSARAEPSSGTFTLLDESGSELVSAAATTQTGGVATYSLSAATVPATLAYSDAWLARWVLTYSGQVETFEQPTCLVRADWRSPITPGDLVSRHGEFARGEPLDPQQDGGEVTLGTWIEEASVGLFTRLWTDGRRPWLIIDPWAAREHLISRALAVAFRYSSTFVEDVSTLLRHADAYDKAAEDAYGRLQFRYDASETGKPADAPRVSGPSVYLLSGNRPSGWRLG